MTIPMSDPYTHSFAQQGWQCPVCQTVQRLDAALRGDTDA